MQRSRLSELAWLAFFALLQPGPVKVTIPPEKKKCNSKQPSESCDWRREAVRTGEFVPDFTLGAWVFPKGPKRTATWAMRYYGQDQHEGDYFEFYVCPECGEDLPPLPLLKNTVDCGGDE